MNTILLNTLARCRKPVWLSRRCLVVSLALGCLGCLGSSMVQAAPSEVDEHPYYQSLLDLMNTSDRFLFKKQQYQRSGRTATARTDIYDLVGENIGSHVLTLDHLISYPDTGIIGISSAGAAGNTSASITTSLDVLSLAPAVRAVLVSMFGDESPLVVKSSFQLGAVEHHLSVSGAYFQDEDGSVQSEGLDAGIVVQGSGALAAYAGIGNTTMAVEDDFSLQLEQLLLALNVIPLSNSDIPLFEFTTSMPGAVHIRAPFGDVPVTAYMRGAELRFGLTYEENTYGAGISAKIDEIFMPLLPVKGASFALALDGISEQGKQALEQLSEQMYVGAQISGDNQQLLQELVRTQLIVPGMGLTLESTFNSFMGEASAKARIELKDGMTLAPSQWRTRGDVLKNVSADVSIDVDRMLYRFIPDSNLPDQAVLDRLLVTDGDTVRIAVHLEDGILWLNDEPMSLSLVFGDELDEPLWPTSIVDGYLFDDEEREEPVAGNETGSITTDNSGALNHQSAIEERQRAEAAWEQAMAERQRAEAAIRKLEAEQARVANEARQAEERRQIVSARAEEAGAARQARQKTQQLAQLRTRYFNAIRQRVEARWQKPPATGGDVDCTVSIVQSTGGEVINVESVRCASGGSALRYSVEKAVLRASPLPVAPDRSLFDRRVKFYFRPN